MNRARATETLVLALLCACAVLSGLLELAFLGEFYSGTALVPITIVAALGGNVILPLWGYRTVSGVRGALLPVLAWLIPILVLTMYNRPEGDLFVLGAYYQDAAFYGLLLAGAAAGFGTVVVLSSPRGAAQPKPPSRPMPSKTSGRVSR